MECKKYFKNITKSIKNFKFSDLKKIKNIKISKAKALLYAPSVCLILAGTFAIFSVTLLKFFLSCFLITVGVLSFRVIKKVYATRNNILSLLGQIDGQILIHKHHPISEEEDLFFSQYANKKNMFH